MVLSAAILLLANRQVMALGRLLRPLGAVAVAQVIWLRAVMAVLAVAVAPMVVEAVLTIRITRLGGLQEFIVRVLAAMQVGTGLLVAAVALVIMVLVRVVAATIQAVPVVPATSGSTETLIVPEAEATVPPFQVRVEQEIRQIAPN